MEALITVLVAVAFIVLLKLHRRGKCGDNFNTAVISENVNRQDISENSSKKDIFAEESGEEKSVYSLHVCCGNCALCDACRKVRERK